MANNNNSPGFRHWLSNSPQYLLGKVYRKSKQTEQGRGIKASSSVGKNKHPPCPLSEFPEPEETLNVEEIIQESNRLMEQLDEESKPYPHELTGT